MDYSIASSYDSIAFKLSDPDFTNYIESIEYKSQEESHSYKQNSDLLSQSISKLNCSKYESGFSLLLLLVFF